MWGVSFVSMDQTSKTHWQYSLQCQQEKDITFYIRKTNMNPGNINISNQDSLRRQICPDAARRSKVSWGGKFDCPLGSVKMPLKELPGMLMENPHFGNESCSVDLRFWLNLPEHCLYLGGGQQFLGFILQRSRSPIPRI